MSEPKACPGCGKYNTDDWPIEVDGKIKDCGCQDCWEAQCDELWWEAVKTYGRIIELMREEKQCI